MSLGAQEFLPSLCKNPEASTVKILIPFNGAENHNKLLLNRAGFFTVNGPYVKNSVTFTAQEFWKKYTSFTPVFSKCLKSPLKFFSAIKGDALDLFRGILKDLFLHLPMFHKGMILSQFISEPVYVP